MPRHIKVKVQTGARKDKIEKVSADSFKCSVKEKPERNMANKRVLALLSSHIGIEEKRLKIVSGHHRPSKIILVED